MAKQQALDLGKLLGFATVSGHASGGIDFQDETIGAKLGAKVGAEAPRDRVEFCQRRGVWAGGAHAGTREFQDEIMGAKLGAKVGLPEDAPITLGAAAKRPA